MRIRLTTIFLFCVLVGHAQTCSSGLGDPIVDITFGSGTGYGPALANGITTLQYQSSQCVLDNAYEIVNHSDNCYVNDWLTVYNDHTGDPNGYFMLIGASDEPSDFYVQTVTGLCGSTQYQFAAWILNMASHTGEILPNITFSIEKTDGTVLQRLETGDVPMKNPLEWTQYAFYFTTPPGVSSVVLRMTNNAPGGYGNDLALDDITFRAAGPSVEISMSGYPGRTAEICQPAPTLNFFSTVESCYPSTSYQWQTSVDNGSTWLDIPAAVNGSYSAGLGAAGTYLYRLTAAQTGNIGIKTCEVVSPVDTVLVHPEAFPAISIQADTPVVCAGALVTFEAAIVDGGPSPAFQWMINGMPEGMNDTRFSTNALNTGDRISCLLTADPLCPHHTTSLSNIISIAVEPTVYPSATISSSAENICSDSLVVFEATFQNAGPAPSYTWLVNGQPAAKDTSIFSSRHLADGDIITLSLTGSLNCSLPGTSDAVTMTVFSPPVIHLTPDTVIKGGNSIQLKPLIEGSPTNYRWTPETTLDNAFIPNPIAKPAKETTYQLIVTDANGCRAVASEKVELFYGFAMPNAFTPNGDGHNDLFRIPPSTPVRVSHFVVFDRWGMEVFSDDSGQTGWDGTMNGHRQPAGTYVWVIEYLNPLIKQMIKEKGTVQLIR